MSEPPDALQSFTETGRSLGLPRHRGSCSPSQREATIEEAEQLRVAPGSVIFHLERVRVAGRSAGGAAPGAGAAQPGADAVECRPDKVSIYAALEQAGHPPTRSDCDVRAEMPTQRDSRLLGAAPLLVVRQVTYDQRMTPIELSEIRYRGDRYHLKTSLHRDPSIAGDALLRPPG